ncbi:MAG TPA: hypothetical protein P5555_19985 [Candidatus Paceibacterota bacterium]|nr:hypothetical protein [Verrucomicrobiota bacterium]HRZ47465.1 hypothetical protein [Candidatus Paceibacterota bacterium]
MKLSLLCHRVAGCLVLGAVALLAGEPAAPHWALQPRRMIQTNLREIDARMDLDAYVAALEEAKANVVLFNMGGIVANYPSDLPYHYRNPFMEGDYAGEVLERLHARGIRMLARFDFSKVNESIAARDPGWLSRDRQGRPFPAYNGQVPVCLNGWYQQEGMLQILREVLDRYPIDGVFFNMIGYPRSDYSGRPLDLCQCDGCKTRFRAMFDLELPRQDSDDDIGRAYRQFQQRTVSEQFLRVQQLVRSRNPALFVCTYTSAGVDVIRSESNTPFHRWAYEDSEKARLALLDHPDRQLANAAVHFPHYAHRLTSVSPNLTRRRLLQCMLNGAWLDFYCIGPFHAQEDRLGLDQVRDVFRFHAENERWFLDTAEQAGVGLIVDLARQTDEQRGLLRILTESHRIFDLVSLARSDLSRYPALILPIVAPLSESAAAALDRYVAQGGRLLLTGGPASPDLRCAGIRSLSPPIRQAQGTYVRIRPEDRLRLRSPVLDRLDLVMLEGDLWPAKTDPDVAGLLRFIPPAMFGPPEKCYYTNVSDVPCLHFRQSGVGRVAWFPWRIGAHYQKHGHAGYAALLAGALDQLLAAPRRLIVQTPALVEVNHRAGRTGQFEWVSLLNHTGEMDSVLLDPVPIRDVRIRLQPRSPIQSVRLLKAGRDLPWKPVEGGWIECVLPDLPAYEIILFQY